MVVNQGDLFWIDLAEPIGSAPGFSRPHVIVQNNALNHRLNTVMACPLTTNLRRATDLGNVRLSEGEGGLSKESVVVVSQVMTFDKSELREYIGALPAKRVSAVLDGISQSIAPREYEEKPNVD